jgi:Transposase DDE domain
MAVLFKLCGEKWGHQSARKDLWKGLALYGVDGTSFSVADTEENVEHFGYTNSKQGKSGYPKLRMCALMALKSHIICDVDFGPFEKGEYHYAKELWSSLPGASLVIVDRHYLSAGLLNNIHSAEKNIHWLIPSKANSKWSVIKEFNEFDRIVEMKVTHPARKKHPELGETWIARAITYKIKDFTTRTVFTSLLDNIKYPAGEIAELYHLRWEIELGYAELKTDMLSTTQRPLRSKSPTAVNQELWGALIAYNLVRLEIERIAKEAKVEPLRISFTMVYFWIMDEWIWCVCATPGAIPRHLKNLRAKVKEFILPKRKKRSFPRAVKIKMSNYARKRPNHE